jgi:lipid II:glycine glycyltransferase (peptidoglycan interpeptide bridge formation enzyme)
MIFNDSFLQSDIWGTFRETQGWHAHRAAGILILERPLPFGHSLLYSPEVNASPEILLELLPAVKEIAGRRKSLVFRLELQIDKQEPITERWRAGLHYAGFQKSFEDIQPADRQIVTLGDDATMLAHMKQKGRYNMRVSEKAGVLVRESTAKTLEADIALFTKLLQTTAKREKFQTRSETYFQTLAETLYRHNCGRVFIATYQNQAVAGAIITLYENLAAYLYGGSSRDHREVMAPYGLHWSVMQWAASLGATHYDLLAISPEGKTNHKYDGITRFKQQFGGEAIHLMGAWDLVLNPTWYTAFKTAEQIRR